MLSPQAIKQIDRLCAQLDHSGTHTQLAVVTIHTLHGADIAGYALRLGNSWGIGREGSDRGILVLFAIDDHKWRIEIGKGLEATLPDSKVQIIGNRMTPQLKANNFDGAITLVVHELAEAVSSESHQPAVGH